MEKLTAIQKRQKQFAERILQDSPGEQTHFTVEWVRSSTWRRNARITTSQGVVGHATGCGYDKLSACVGEALRYLSPTGYIKSCGAGIRPLIKEMDEYGFILERSYEGKQEDGFAIARKQ